jgi:hydrogenase/urease accessory protein HupE
MKCRRRIFLIVAALLLITTSLQAHESRPAYLEINQTTASRYEVIWHTPVNAGVRLPLVLKFPDEVRNVTEPALQERPGSLIERRLIETKDGLPGKRIEITGLQATITDVLVRVKGLDGLTQVTRLTPSSPSFIVEASPGVVEVARTYTVLGIEHILSGIDHLLFVLALLIITQGGWKLVKTVTAFTLSHSVTLTAVTLGFVNVPTRPVEAVIALSIVFVAAEILHWKRGRIGIAARAPWVVAFAFGLIHGLGFAGGLSDIGLPTGHIPTALLFFSLGVETGHFMFIGAVLSFIALVRRLNISVPSWAEWLPPYAIGGIAMFWVIQRIAAF